MLETFFKITTKCTLNFFSKKTLFKLKLFFKIKHYLTKSKYIIILVLMYFEIQYIIV